MFIDSHCHIDGPEYDADREEVIARAREAGVTTMLTVGTGDPHSDAINRAVDLAEQQEGVYAAVGVHPHDAKLFDDAAERRLLDLVQQSKRVIAWGEIGLDYHYDHSPRDVQARVFRHQLEQARSAQLPIVIHCREAWPDCLKILNEDWRSSALGGIFHCFAGTIEEARQGIEMGFLISFAGNVTYPKSQNLRDVAREISLDRLLVETDSPFLAPLPYRGKRNEPAYVAEVARSIANVRNLAAEGVARATAENFCKFFGLANSMNHDMKVPGGTPSHF